MHNREIKVDKNIQRWEEKIIQIFPKAIPNTCIWKDEIDILNILFTLCDKNLNNIFYPNGQVYDLMGVDFSKEDRCLELITDSSIDVIKPTKLSFHYYDEAFSWAYFRIETDNLEQTPIYDYKCLYKEDLVMLDNGQYIDIYNWYRGEYEDENNIIRQFSNKDQIISRFLSKSSFLIFPKGSYFNNIYEKSYNMLESDELENTIEEFIPKG